MEEIIKKLKQEIINHDLVKNSSLLSSFQWKRAQYIVLSDIISESLSKSEFMQGSKKNELGVTISCSTLQRIFTNDYSERKNNDLRFLKTLDKLAIFLGYQNLNNFLLNQGANEKVQFNGEKVKANHNNIENIEGLDVPICFFTKIITDFCQEEFEVMKKLPIFSGMGRLGEYAFEDSPLYKRAHDMLLKYAELNLTMNCENNRSNFEVYGFKLRNIDQDRVVISTKEFCNMQWIDSNGITTHTYNKASNQLYFFRKKEGIWKIWDNHNPGYDTLAADFLKSKS